MDAKHDYLGCSQSRGDGGVRIINSLAAALVSSRAGLMGLAVSLVVLGLRVVVHRPQRVVTAVLVVALVAGGFVSSFEAWGVFCAATPQEFFEVRFQEIGEIW